MRRTFRSLVTGAAAAALVLPALLDSGATAFARGPAGWRTVQEFGASYGYPQVGGVVAPGARSAWVAGDTYMAQDSVFLAHWNGSRWSQVAVPKALTTTSASVSSGPLVVSRTGVWDFPTVYAATQNRDRVYAARLTSRHWSLWRLRGALAIGGAAVSLPTPIPGTTSYWSTGDAQLGGGMSVAVVFKLGP